MRSDMMCQRKFYPLLVLVVVLDLVSGLTRVTSSSQKLESKANYSCYSCPLSEANSIDVVYNKHNTKGDFWYRNGSALASCDFSFISTSKRKCSVCLNDSVGAETVVIVLCNLTSGEEPLFEGKNGDISFNKTDCPSSKPIDLFELHERNATQTNRGGRGHVCLFVPLIIIIIIIIIIVIIVKCQKSPDDASNTNPSDPEKGPGD